ncbi:MAG: hypothetical protein H3C34_08595 [Caldilineaceae bacterium]|nr:hypothetical protein [Caldilineaceae bacterium]
MPIADALPQFLALFASLAILALLSRQIGLQTQLAPYYLTGSEDMATIIVFLLFVPGVIVHEGAHWLSARLLGLRTGKFRVWPTRQGKHIGLGSVTVERSDMWRDSLVGTAPLLFGTALIALIGAWHFGAPTVAAALVAGRLVDSVSVFFKALGRTDGIVWAYVIFTIGNSMMPSASDREPVKPVLLYGAFAALVYLVVGLPIEPITLLLGWMMPAFQIVTSALIFTILLDLIILGILLLITLPFRLQQRHG